MKLFKQRSKKSESSSLQGLAHAELKTLQEQLNHKTKVIESQKEQLNSKYMEQRVLENRLKLHEDTLYDLHDRIYRMKKERNELLEYKVKYFSLISNLKIR